MSKDLFRTIQSACLISSHLPLFGEALNEFEGSSVISTFAPRLRPSAPWRRQIVEGWLIVAVAYWESNEVRCILSREGDVNLYGPGGTPDRTYQIPEAGVMRADAAGYGYVNRIRAIGNSLYVCGQSRQVYRFVAGAEHVLDGHWEEFAGAMRQPPMDEPPEDAGDAKALDRWLDDNDAVDLEDIAGSSDSDLYAAGDECWHFDGQRWQQLQLPTDEAIHAIKVLDAEHVVMVGHNGTVLMGNARTGFAELSSAHDNQNFTGVEWFDGRLYLASNLGLFTYDPASRKIQALATALQPPLQDSHLLEAKGGVLWSFGFKDLAYCEGKTWTRVDHPDNPPIR